MRRMLCAYEGRRVVLSVYERLSGDYKLEVNMYIAVLMEAILGMAL
jgi:hypothetical protein